MNIGDNATIRFHFNRIMSTATINNTTVTLRNGPTPLPFSMVFAGSTAVTLTTQAPLLDNSTIAPRVVGRDHGPDGCFHRGPERHVSDRRWPRQDRAGGRVPNPDSNQTTNVPIDTWIFTWVLNEPIDAASLVPGG